jgi:hypothetical protein
MKTLRLFLGIFAFVFAMGGAVASKHSLSATGYERIPASGTTLQCVARGQCNQMTGPECQFRKEDASLVPLGDVNDITSDCGTILRHSQNGGVIN